MKTHLCLPSPVGFLTVYAEDNAISAIKFEHTPNNSSSAALLNLAKLQLQEYFSGTRQHFTLPLAPHGTPFQQKIWQCLQTIPYGKTYSYKELARMAGNEKACRAVGMANHNNPIPIIIPCHRVIGTNGKLIGYAGGLHIKQRLLELEKNSLQAPIYRE